MTSLDLLQFSKTLDLFYFTKIRMMFKLLVFVMIFVVPIFGGVSEGGRKKFAVEKAFEELWRQTCKNVSGVDVDFERNERLHLEYKNCRDASLNTVQLQQDLKVFSNLSNGSNFTIPDVEIIKSDLITLTQKYCPKVHKYVRCNEIKSPIYNECFTATEIKGIKLNDDVSLRFNDFFCENNAERLTQFIDGNVTECAMAKPADLMGCYEAYVLSMLEVSNTNLLLGLLPNPDILCKSTDNLQICVTPLFESCEVSTNAGELIKSLFTSIHTLCDEFFNSTVTR